jgi:chromosome segregation ATPase
MPDNDKPKTGQLVLKTLGLGFTGIQALLNAIERRVVNVLAIVEIHDSKLSEIAGRLDAQDVQLDVLTRGLVDLNKRTLEILGRIDDSNNILATMSDDLGVLRVDYADLRQALRDIDGSLGGEIEAVAQAVANLGKSMPDVQEIVDDLRRIERSAWLASTKPAF